MPTALIVEDEAVIALDLATELKALGLDILGLARSYEQAMEIVERALPDIAIVDLVLSGLSHGMHVAEELRSRGAQVLITSGREPAAVHPDVRFLAKPWTRDDLVRALGILPEAAD